ncbi:hypothetical protein [Cytobacillus oceanisediminis]|nr:hypothetical protein [Cytobacillus oceanisediminis]
MKVKTTQLYEVPLYVRMFLMDILFHWNRKAIEKDLFMYYIPGKKPIATK